MSLSYRLLTYRLTKSHCSRGCTIQNLEQQFIYLRPLVFGLRLKPHIVYVKKCLTKLLLILTDFGPVSSFGIAISPGGLYLEKVYKS